MPKTKNTEDYRKTHLCPRCKYRGDISGGDGYGYNIHCNYAIHAKQTALEYRKDGPPVDRRGDDRKQCRLYAEGNPQKILPQKPLFRPREEFDNYDTSNSKWQRGVL